MGKLFSYCFIALLFCNASAYAQSSFSHADSLRGQYGATRKWWDLQRYDIELAVNIPDSGIVGKNTIKFKAAASKGTIQIDLQAPMILDNITFKNKKVNFTKDGAAYFFPLSGLKVGAEYSFVAFFHGIPRKAVRPPWDGGFIWRKSADGSPFISVACQSLGASVWYPCKDHQADEPDKGVGLSIAAPDSLMSIANGRLVTTTKANGIQKTTWNVTAPINNYNVVPYIGKYAHFSEQYNGEAGLLTIDCYVLQENLEKAKLQFKDVSRMLKAFEHWFGPYPFYKDGYKIVEAPHLGMEHQSAIAYGNKYQNGYLGNDLSGSKNKWGLKFDFIIVHESGHEWFANNITTKDIADMWVHEGFTNYSETLFTDYWYGTAAGNEYCTGTRKRIQNDIPIIGPYGVNQEGSGDMYYKAGNMIHTIRQVVNSDDKFRQILRGLNKVFYHQTVTTAQIENYISKESGFDFGKVFDQYLRTIQIPTLEYKQNGGSVEYRYVDCIKGFNLPLKLKGSNDLFYPTQEWQTLTLGTDKEFAIDDNFLIKTKKAKEEIKRKEMPAAPTSN